MITRYKQWIPETENAAFIAWNAHVSGKTILGKGASVWYGSTLRGDLEQIEIGDETNIQDNSVCHTSNSFPLVVGKAVTVGHGAILHGCKIGDNCLIGMGAIILDGAVIEKNSIVAAGTLIPPGKKYPPGSLIMGNPGRVVRGTTPEDEEMIRQSSKRYTEKAEITAMEEIG